MQKPDLRKEFRLGLVLYGGVSLAIYINGCCREFYNAVRGRGIYKLLKALTDSDIVVDVISGTSAGGINGVLLSYALANSNNEEVVDFADFAEIWRNQGNIEALMRQPGEKQGKPQADSVNSAAEATDAISILDGDGYYQQELTKGIGKAAKRVDEAASGAAWPSEVRELNLFVTGSDLAGKVSKAFDNTGRVIEVKDHRTVFVLKHRQGRKHPFRPAQAASLAKLCRITSCFPVAFPTVTVSWPSTGREKASKIDRLLIEWGDLDRRELPLGKEEYQLHFTDGGVLDNRPFSYTIEQIAQQAIAKPVERKLFYIDPSPERFINSPQFNKMEKPSFWASALEAVRGLPSYESIANDLKAISQHNEKVSRYQVLQFNAEKEARVEVAKNAQQVKVLASTGAGSIPDREVIYLRCRLVSLRDRILPVILGLKSKAPSDEAYLKKVAELLNQTVNEDKAMGEISQQIRNLDVSYARRKHFFLLERLCQSMTQESTQAQQQYPQLKKLASKIQNQIELLSVIEFALNEFLASSKVRDDFQQLVERVGGPEINGTSRTALYEYILKLHRYFLASNYCQPPASNQVAPATSQKLENIPADFFERLPEALFSADDRLGDSAEAQVSARISAVLAQLQTKSDEYAGSSEIVENSYEWDDSDREQEGISIIFKIEESTIKLIEQNLAALPATRQKFIDIFASFRAVDEFIYPYEYLSDFPSKEAIQIFRISPYDAKLGFSAYDDRPGSNLRKAEDKLAGDQLSAFGGFFKKSWRSNDILWGRLDGLNLIVESLITEDSLRNFKSFMDRQSQPAAQVIEELLSSALPHATTEEHAKLVSQLNYLAQNKVLSDATSAEARSEKLQEFQNLIITIAHRQIIEADLPTVLEDMIEQQLSWNQQKTRPKDPKDSLTFHPIEGYFDRAVTPYALAELARESIAKIKKDGGLSQYFQDPSQYRVGREGLGDMPQSYVFNLLARASLVIRDVIESSPPSSFSDKVRRSSIFATANRLLQAAYWLTIQVRSPNNFSRVAVLKFLPGLLLPIVGIALLFWLVQSLPTLLLAALITLAIIKFGDGKLGPKWLAGVLVLLVVGWLGLRIFSGHEIDLQVPMTNLRVKITY